MGGSLLRMGRAIAGVDETHPMRKGLLFPKKSGKSQGTSASGVPGRQPNLERDQTEEGKPSKPWGKWSFLSLLQSWSWGEEAFTPLSGPGSSRARRRRCRGRVDERGASCDRLQQVAIPVSLHPACIWSQRHFTLRASLEGMICCQKPMSSACPDFGGEGGLFAFPIWLGNWKNTDLRSQFPPDHHLPRNPSVSNSERCWTGTGGDPCSAAGGWGPLEVQWLCSGHGPGRTFGNGAEGRAKVPGWGLGAPA